MCIRMEHVLDSFLTANPRAGRLAGTESQFSWNREAVSIEEVVGSLSDGWALLGPLSGCLVLLGSLSSC